jgi:hypothetical protein
MNEQYASKSAGELPNGFDELRCFVEVWALSGSMERWQRRISSRMSDIRAFYDAMLPRMDEIMTLLAKKEVKDLTAQERNLFYLALAFMDVGPAVEIYGTPQLPDTVFDINRVDMVRLSD